MVTNSPSRLPGPIVTFGIYGAASTTIHGPCGDSGFRNLCIRSRRLAVEVFGSHAESMIGCVDQSEKPSFVTTFWSMEGGEGGGEVVGLVGLKG